MAIISTVNKFIVTDLGLREMCLAMGSLLSVPGLVLISFAA